MINNNKHNQITTTYYLLLNKRTVNDVPKLSETTAPYIFKIRVKNTSPFPPERQ